MNDTIYFSARIQNILLFIHNNYKKGISLIEISTTFNADRFYLDKVFKREIGIPIKKFIIIKRLYEAACMLRSNPNSSATLVCFDVGFNDFSNFIRGFKKYFGCSPIKFKNCRKEPRQCELRKNSFIYFLSNKKTRVGEGINADVSAVCYLGRTRKARK